MTTTFQRDPAFGWDPWVGPGIPPIESDFTHEEIILAAKLYTGQDTLSGDIHLLVPGLDMYGSYVDNFKGWEELKTRFGTSGAFLLPITIFGDRATAICADIERGAMIPSDIPGWTDAVTARLAGKQLPWIYTSAGNLSTCNAEIGSRHVIRWSAHYGFGPHVCGPGTCGFPQADWTQWADTGPNGENYDRSVGFLLPGQTVPLPKGEQAMSITAQVNENRHSEVFVHLASGEVKNLYKVLDDKTGVTGWNRNQDGTFAWESLGNPGK